MPRIYWVTIWVTFIIRLNLSFKHGFVPKLGFNFAGVQLV